MLLLIKIQKQMTRLVTNFGWQIKIEQQVIE
jgi:hypothetical protein